MDPTPLCSSPSVLQINLVFNWSILNDNVKTHLFFEFNFAAFPGNTIRLSITGKSSATLILAGENHWLGIITRLSGYVIENLTWILYTIFYNVSESLVMILSQ